MARVTPSDVRPGSIGGYLWMGIVIGVVGVVTGLWTQTQFAHYAGVTIGFIWQCITVLITSIPDIIAAARGQD